MTAKNSSPPAPPRSHWLCILCLIGLDYFSSLAYQPSLAFESAGLLAPLATVLVVLFTLFGALPVYFYVAGRSPDGQGAVGLLERLIPGWFGKLLMVVLLGFIATDFVITRTLSTADAAVHLLDNPQPLWQHVLARLGTADESARNLLPYPFWGKLIEYWNKQLVATIILSILAFVFWAIFRRGFTRRVIQLAVGVVTVYLTLTAVIIGSALAYLSAHLHLLQSWWATLSCGIWHPQARPLAPNSWWLLALLCLASFPKLALGMSGFELSMVVMPLVRGRPAASPEADRRQRIRNTRKLLVLAAFIMSVYLLGSTLVTTTLISPQALTTPGQAENRSLAYLAHGGRLVDGTAASEINPVFGGVFGSLYDLMAIVILCLAGASVAIGLRNFVPDYLHRLGMELDWAHRVGMSLYIFNCINLVVTVLFRASVTAQRGAYATSVLVLISSASVAAVLERRRGRQGGWLWRLPWGFLLIAVLFHLAMLAAIVTKPDGLFIALCFVVAILVSSIVSRAVRSTELRFEGFEFTDPQSQFLWESLEAAEFPVIVPHRPGHRSLVDKEEQIRKRHRLTPDVPVVFLEAELSDASVFCQRPLLEVIQEEGRFVIRVKRCCSIPHVIANVGLAQSKVGQPPEIHFGWSNESPIEANLSFLLFGKGNVPWMVRELIRRAEPDPERQPRVVIG